MKLILAISGGVDSMLMLDLLYDEAQFAGEEESLVVAHFDHGMRPSSKDDAEFVERLVKNDYRIEFRLGEGHLSPDASEAEAREARYKFLKGLADEYNGVIVTAHHINDLVESVAINMTRGTGWRGLAPFSDDGIAHPFLGARGQEMTRQMIVAKAAERGLRFRQDPTNNEPRYLRNRLREDIERKFNPIYYRMMLNWFNEQTTIRRRVDKIAMRLQPADGRYERAWFLPGGPFEPKEIPGREYVKKWRRPDGVMVDLDDEVIPIENDLVAIEFLRAALARIGVSATRPQLYNFLSAIRTYKPEKQFNLPGDKMIVMHKDYFEL